MSANSKDDRNNEDTEKLFVTRTIAEIRQVEQKARLDIERKREDLRQLVGERYRDMIEGADSVIFMKEAIVKIVDILAGVGDSVSQVHQKHLIKGTGGQQAPPTTTIDQSVMSQIRLAVELQDKIWGALDNQGYLTAGQSYLLMEYVCGRLRGLDVRWPNLILQTWQRTSTIKDKIIQCCHGYLQSSLVCEKITTECLVTLWLLEECSLMEVFQKFLGNRFAAIKHLCLSTNMKSVKDEISDVISSLKLTLFLISQIFISSNLEDDAAVLVLLKNTLNSKANQVVTGQLVYTLPPVVLDYKVVKDLSCDIDAGLIKESTSDWLNDCLPIAQDAFTQALSHITTLKGLASIRNSLYQLLSQMADGTTSMLTHTNWTKLCQSTTGGYVNLYDQFVKDPLVDRAKGIISYQLAQTKSHLIACVNQMIRHHESHPGEFAADANLSAYIWAEMGGSSGLVGGNGNRNEMMDVLEMKTKCCTPQLYSFFKDFDSRLRTAIEDIGTFEAPPNQETAPTQSSVVDNEFPFHWKNDTSLLREQLENDLNQLISELLSSIDTLVQPLQLQLTSSSSNTFTIDKILMLARLCQCMLDFTPSLQNLIISPNQNSFRLFKSSQPNKMTSTHKHRIVDMLSQKVDGLYHIWSNWLADAFCTQVEHVLHSKLDTVILANVMNWETITIKEEAEDGSEITSNIIVPSQASLCYITNLFSLCQEVARIGGWNINRSILSDLAYSVFQKVMECLLQMDLPSKQLSQEFSLQVIFDVKFLSAVLCPLGWEEKWSTVYVKYTEVIESLTRVIDPFDYDVILPHLNKMVDRQFQRTKVMFGSLVNAKGPSLYNKTSLPTGNYQEKHVIIPLSTTLPRLSTLYYHNGGNQSLSTVNNTLTVSKWMDCSLLEVSFVNISEALQHF